MVLRMLRRSWWVLKRSGMIVGAVITLYILVILVGLIPVNSDFAPTTDGIRILLVSNPVHADVVVPLDTDVIDWREAIPSEVFRGDTSQATHVAFGWGDKGFYIETPTWSDLRASTAAQALFWPSGTCMHVSFIRSEHFGDEARSVTISPEQYERLVEFITSSFQVDEFGDRISIEGVAYGSHDAFFEAYGNYHCLNTCNCWVGGALRSAGVRTGWLTPLPKTVFLFLPPEE